MGDGRDEPGCGSVVEYSLMNEVQGSFSKAIEQKEVMRLVGIGVGVGALTRTEWSSVQ